MAGPGTCVPYRPWLSTDGHNPKEKAIEGPTPSPSPILHDSSPKSREESVSVCDVESVTVQAEEAVQALLRELERVLRDTLRRQTQALQARDQALQASVQQHTQALTTLTEHSKHKDRLQVWHVDGPTPPWLNPPLHHDPSVTPK